MKSFTVKTRGLDIVLKEKDRWAKAKVDEADRVMTQAAQKLLSDASANAPSKIRGSLYANTSQRLKKTVGSNNVIAAYLEFGTGKKVFKGTAFQFTEPQKDFAKQFKRPKDGNTQSFAYLFPALKRAMTWLDNQFITTLSWKRGDRRRR